MIERSLYKHFLVEWSLLIDPSDVMMMNISLVLQESAAPDTAPSVSNEDIDDVDASHVVRTN